MGKMASAFKRAHEYTDKLLEWGKDENSRVRWSGCSTLTCVIQDTGIKDNTNKEFDHQENNTGGATPPKVTFAVEPPKELGLIHLANAGKMLNLRHTYNILLHFFISRKPVDLW